MKTPVILTALLTSAAILLPGIQYSSGHTFSKTATDSYDTDNDSIIKKKSQVRLAIRYISDYYFMGRSDSVKAPYISPYLGYFHKSNFFAEASLSYLLTKDQNRIDLFRLSAGYDYKKKKLSTGIAVSQFFFSEESFVVQSEITTSVYAYAEYDFRILTICLDGRLAFSGKTDVFAGSEINHTFYLLKNKLRIIPAVYLNAGTNNYYTAYYTDRSSSSKGGGYGKGKGGQTNNSNTQSIVQISSDQHFELLDYEADIYLVYVHKNTRFIFAPTWVFPVNPTTFVTPYGTDTEVLKNGFYIMLGVRWIL